MSYTELAGLVTFRPLSSPLPPPGFEGWSGSPFRASFTDTVEVLVRELGELRPSQTILEVDLRETDLRLDGMPRANVTARSPGIILTLIGAPKGDGLDLRYPSHHFGSWQANLRAIALGLEALRKVDRYRIAPRGEQYAGWKALASGSVQARDVDRGRELIAQHGSVRAARMAVHPDRGGDAEDFKAVQAAVDAGAT